MYDMDSKMPGIRDCPKCQHTMAYLSKYNAIERNEGYMIDDGKPNSSFVYFFFGWIGVVLKLFYRYTLQPLMSKQAGEQRQKRYAGILREHPTSLICLHCSYILKRK